MTSVWRVLAAVAVLLLAGCSATEESRTILLPVESDPTVTLKVWFDVGSMDDPPGKEGLAWITGQLLADGGTTAHDYETVLAKLYPLAAGYGIRVDRQMTVLSGRAHRETLDRYVPLFVDAFARPAFDEQDFERIKTDTLNYLENTLRYSSDEELAKAVLMASIFEGTRYAHPPQGTVAGVTSITLDDVRAFYAERFGRAGARVALGGGYDDALVTRLEQALELLPPGSPRSAEAPRPVENDARRVVLVDKPNADASISFGVPIDVRRGEREYYALWIANSWLGEHRNSSSHLYKVIRETRGMNYGDYSYIEAFPEGGRRSFPPVHVGRDRQLFEVWIRTLPDEQAQFAIRAAMREIETLVRDGMDPEAFELTREFLRKYVLHFADTTSGRLGYAVDDRFYGIDGEGHLARFRAMLDEITLDEVNAAVRTHFALDRLTFAIVTGEAATLAEALAADTPSPIEYPTPKSDEVLAADREIAAVPLSIDAERVRTVPLGEVFAD